MIEGDCLQTLKAMADESAQAIDAAMGIQSRGRDGVETPAASSEAAKPVASSEPDGRNLPADVLLLLQEAAQALTDVSDWASANWHTREPHESVARARTVAALLRQRLEGEN